jgi:hypothetical protein
LARGISAGGVALAGDGRVAVVGEPQPREGPALAHLYAVQPVVSGLAPRFGPLEGGTEVTITGSELASVRRVAFGAKPAASFTVDSPTQIRAVTPATSSPGAVPVEVSDRHATGRGSGSFTYLARPVVTAISPDSGPTAGGTTVTVTGQNFAGGVAVRFGAAPAASVVVVSATEVRAVSPPRSAGLVDVTVTTPGGTSQTGAADAFRYQAPALPDLVVDDLTGGSVTVRNIGLGTSDAFVVAVTLRGNLAFPGLTPGGSATQTFSCVTNVTATVDPDNRIAESNETNNSRTVASICLT